MMRIRGSGVPGTWMARRRPSSAGATVVFALVLGWLLACAAWAGDDPGIAFEIAPAPLDRALADFAEQSGAQLLYSPVLARGRHAAAVSGRMSPRQALARLLAHSGLVAEPVRGGAYVLRERPPEARTPPPSPPSPDDAPVSPPVLRRVLVTGSRIPRAGLETTLPVSIIDREDIELGGFTTLFDLLRHQPGMSGHHAIEAATEDMSRSLTSLVPTAVAQSASLYGLGPRGTLYLVDGRRIANYALPSTNLGGLTDLGAIPLSMVERVEILRGGASAIYGADAVAGVVNIILRRDYRGGEANVLYGLSERGDAETMRASASAGFGAGASQVSLFADRFSQAHLPGTARGWHTRDRRADGLEDATYPLGYYNSTFDGPPILPSARCTAAADGRDPACRLDRERYRSLRPAADGTSLRLHWAHPLDADGDAELYAEIRTTALRTRMETAPTTYSAPVPTHDPMYGQAYMLAHAFHDVGQVSSRNRTTSADATFGVRFPVAAWSVEADASRSTHRVESTIEGVVNQGILQRAIDTGTYRFDGHRNDDAILRALSPTLRTRGRAGTDTMSLRGSGPLMQWRGGTILAAVGAEARRETLDYRPDPYFGDPELEAPLEDGPIRGSSRREAVFAEAEIPLSRRVWIEAAGRLDRADAHGSEVSPRLGLGWRPNGRLALRASVAESFRAPTLYETLSRPPPDGYFGNLALLRDATLVASCAQVLDDGCVLPIGAARNPSLEPEQALTRTLGLVWSPRTGLDVTLDYFNVIRNNEIAVASAVVDGRARLANLERDENGHATALTSRYLNTARTDVRGLHLDADWTLQTAAAHRWGVRLAGHYLRRVRVAGADGAGAASWDQAGHLAPRFAANASLQWRAGDWTAALHLRHFGGYRIHRAQMPCPPAHVEAGRCTNPSVNLLAVHVARDLGDAWRISAHVDNLADRQPANHDIDRAGYNGAIDDPVGRQYLLRVTYRF